MMMMMTGNEISLQNSGKLHGFPLRTCEHRMHRAVGVATIHRSRARRQTDGPNFFVGWNSWTVVGGGDEIAPTAAGSHGPPRHVLPWTVHGSVTKRSQDPPHPPRPVLWPGRRGNNWDSVKWEPAPQTCKIGGATSTQHSIHCWQQQDHGSTATATAWKRRHRRRPQRQQSVIRRRTCIRNRKFANCCWIQKKTMVTMDSHVNSIYVAANDPAEQASRQFVDLQVSAI
jgi:hypothetical protein